MTKHVLKIRVCDKNYFDLIKLGQKTIETRVASEKFQKIKVGDTLEFICGKVSLEKKVMEVHHFLSIDALLKKLDLKEIMPQVASVRQAKKIWYRFPNYREKIQKHGLLAFRLDRSKASCLNKGYLLE